VEGWKDGKVEERKDETIRQLDNSTMEGWNVEALAEIPLRREKNGRMEAVQQLLKMVLAFLPL